MPYETRKLPFKGDAYRNLDDEVLTDGTALLMDAYTDDAGATHKRPGLTSFCSIGVSTSVDGLYWWDEQSTLLAVCNGNLYTISNGGSATSLGSIGGGGKRATFANEGNNLIIADGATMYYWDGASSAVTLISDADAPTDVSFVAHLDGYILANSLGNNKFYWSDGATTPPDPTTWTATGAAEAEAHPDKLNGVFVSWREILLTGRRSAEIWFNDGESPFARLEGAYIEVGTRTPYTVKQHNGIWVFLSSDRRVGYLDGRRMQHFSRPMDKQIEALSTIEDAWAEVISIGGRIFYVLQFPTAGRTFVYDGTKMEQSGQGWAEWSYFNPTTAVHEAFLGNCYAEVMSDSWTNRHFWGSRKNDGIIYRMNTDVYQDNSSTLRTVRRTGHINHGSHSYKINKQVRLRLQRGFSVTSPKILIRWRKDNTSWSQYYEMDIGNVGDTEMIAKIDRVGRYRTIQYEIVHTENTEFTLVDGEEDVRFIERG